MSQFFQTIEGGLPLDVLTSVITDSGTAIPANNILDMNGGDGIIVTAVPTLDNNIIISMTGVLHDYTDVTNPNPGHESFPFTASTTADYYISVDSTLGPVVIKLPDAGSATPPPSKSTVIIKDRAGQSQTYNITIQSETAAATIDGQASYTFVNSYQAISCLFFGSNYEIY